MRKAAAALALALTTTATGIGSVATAPTALAQTKACPAVPADHVSRAVASVPRAFPNSPWQVSAHGSSVDCALNWVQIVPKGATGSSPTQILLFDHFKYTGTATKKPRSFTTVVGDMARGQIKVRFRWLVGNDIDANPTGHADVRYQTGPHTPPHPIDPIPPQPRG